jgi:hypothetical protein
MMAESKKSFVLYCDLIHTVEHLPNDKAGELFKHILSYVNDRDPVTDCIVVKLAFEPIRQQLKRDLQTWEKKVEERSESGRAGNLKRWNQDLYDRYMNGECLDDLEKIARHRKASLPDPTRSLPIANIAVNGNVNGNGTVNEKKRKEGVTAPPPLVDEVIAYFKENGYTEASARRAWEYYNASLMGGKRTWSDSTGKPIKNWKMKMQSVWFKDEHKIEQPKIIHRPADPKV